MGRGKRDREREGIKRNKAVRYKDKPKNTLEGRNVLCQSVGLKLLICAVFSSGHVAGIYGLTLQNGNRLLICFVTEMQLFATQMFCVCMK